MGRNTTQTAATKCKNKNIFVYTHGRATDKKKIDKVVISSPCVTSIDHCAFEYCINLIEVVITHTYITEIGPKAFRYCASLQHVSLPNSVTSIGESAFYDCVSLLNIQLPNAIKTMGPFAFNGCTALSEVILPSGTATVLTEIADSLFYGCSSLHKINIPCSVTAIGSEAFYGCESLPALSMPTSVTKIGDNAFYGCSSLGCVSLPETATNIASNAFHNCTTLSTMALPRQRNKRVQQRQQQYQHCHSRNAYDDDAIRFDGCTVLDCLKEEEEENGSSTSIMMECWLQHRYDQLPLHDICYRSDITAKSLEDCFDNYIHNHSNRSTNYFLPANNILLLQKPASNNDESSQLTTTTTTTTTPFHLLAANTEGMNRKTVSIFLTKAIQIVTMIDNNHNEDDMLLFSYIITLLTATDLHQKTPLFYACRCHDEYATLELFQALTTTHDVIEIVSHHRYREIFVAKVIIPMVHMSSEEKGKLTIAYSFVKQIAVVWGLIY